MAKRNAVPVPDSLIDTYARYRWDDFTGFLNAYDAASSVIQTKQDYRDIAYEYLVSAANEGAIYIEMFTSPDHAAAIGIDYLQMNAGIAQGIDDAERETGIIGRMVATCVRHLGPERALSIATMVARNPHPYVVGFGMGGDETQFDPQDFAAAFNLAFDSGLPCTVHAGEVAGPTSVQNALDALPVSRIGHGVRAIEDMRLVERLVDEGIILEICPGSNLALGLYETPATHPLPSLMSAGCLITLGSDDPPFFGTSIGAEYTRTHTEFGLSDADLLQITRNAIDAAFVDEETKIKLRERL